MSCRNVEFLIVKSKSLCPQPGAVLERGKQGETKGTLYKSCGELSLLKYYSPTVTHDKTFVYDFCVL